MLSRPNRPHRSISKFTSTLIIVAWLVSLGLVAVNRQNIIDWWRLRDYQAPPAVAQLAQQDTMSDYGRKVFYVNQPEIVSKTSFTSKCPSHRGEQTIVLGCYHGGQAGIFLLDVTDPRLEGVEQVTAAHEMLHAAYDRLSDNERQRINKLLQDYYKNKLTDKRIIETIDAYKKTAPKSIINEMHSIFATEILELPKPLEDYYSRYFTNRKQVAQYAAKYQFEFTSRQDQIARYDADLNRLKAEIVTLEADIMARQAEISSRQDTLVNQRNNGDIVAYNAGVPAYNQLVDSYNAQISTVQGLIRQYNDLVARRNAVALEETQLVEQLRPTTAKPIQN